MLAQHAPSSVVADAEPEQRRDCGKDQRGHHDPGRMERDVPVIDRPGDGHALGEDDHPGHRVLTSQSLYLLDRGRPRKRGVPAMEP